MNKKYNHIVLGLIIAFAAVAFTGCNTIKGIGEDFEKAGEAIQDASK